MIEIPTTAAGPKLLDEMTTREVAAALERTDVAILTTGAIEQHGAHLPLGTDWYIGVETTRRVLQELARRGHQAVGYVFPLGKSEGFLNFAGTLTLRNATFIAVMKEIVRCWHHQGFRRFALLSSNGGNGTAMLIAGEELHRELDCPVVFIDPLPYQISYRQEILKNPAIDHHGAEGETSKILVTHPHLVQLEHATFVAPVGEARPFAFGPGVRVFAGRWEDFAPGGVVGDPRLAAAATGEEAYRRNARWIADILERVYFASAKVG
ncbi:MAG: creatininase family protein [Chloroflexi bacterium]|nr:creatininase family protein [Chloroflexota bacterium]